MGTVVEKFQYIEGTKQAIKKAIKNRGVEVLDTDTFRSYAEKIKEIGSGSGGSSVAEYEYIKTGGIATYPETPYTEGASWFYTDANAYKEGKNAFNAYCGYASATALFDGNEETNYSPYDQRLFFNFNGKPLTKMTLLVDNAHYNGGTITLYGTNDITYATNHDTGIMDKLYEVSVPAHTTKTTFEIKNDKDYKFFRLDTNDSRTTIYSLSFLSDGTVIKMPLKTANMTPTLQGFSEDYMRVVTIPYYHNGDIIESQTLIFKPYEDGGCLVNYTDDGKAVKLGMYLLQPSMETIVTEKKFVQPVLTENGTIGGDAFAVEADSVIDSGRPAYKAFDGNTVMNDASYDQWHSNYGQPHWIKFYNPNLLSVSKVTIFNGADNVMPLDWEFQYSDDNNDWHTLTSGTNTVLTSNGEWSFDVANSGNHKYYRFYTTSGSGSVSSCLGLTEIQITGKEITSVTYDKPIYVLSPDDDFTLEGYREKTQVADLSIPSRFYFNGLEWILGVEDGIALPE